MREIDIRMLSLHQIFGNIFSQCFDQMFDDIFGQVFDQSFWIRKYSVQFYWDGQYSVQFYTDRKSSVSFYRDKKGYMPTTNDVLVPIRQTNYTLTTKVYCEMLSVCKWLYHLM